MELNKIYNGDCYELIKQIPDKSVDLIYTDIPYKMNYGKENSGFEFNDNQVVKSGENMKPLINGIDLKILDEFIRVLKKMNLFIWCSTQQMKSIIDKYGKYRVQILVWHKTNSLKMNRRQFVTDLEYCLCFKEPGVSYSDTGGFHSRFYESASNSKENKMFHHPTTKPSKLVSEHIEFASKPGDIVLDPFSGSGTTCACAKALGRNYIGFELDKTYYEASVERLMKTGENK